MNRILVAIGVALVAAPAFAQPVTPPLKERMAQFDFMSKKLDADSRTQRKRGCTPDGCLQMMRLDMADGDSIVTILATTNSGIVSRALCFGNKVKQPTPICMDMVSGKMFSLGEKQ